MLSSRNMLGLLAAFAASKRVVGESGEAAVHGWDHWSYKMLGLSLGVWVLLTLVSSQSSGKETENKKGEKGRAVEVDSSFYTFQRQYLFVYYTVMLADWLQGTNMYTLYQVGCAPLLSPTLLVRQYCTGHPGNSCNEVTLCLCVIACYHPPPKICIDRVTGLILGLSSSPASCLQRFSGLWSGGGWTCLVGDQAAYSSAFLRYVSMLLGFPRLLPSVANTG